MSSMMRGGPSRHCRQMQHAGQPWEDRMLSISVLEDMKPISADSHIVEPPDIFLSRIDPKYRDICPHGVDHETRGALYIVEGLSPVAVGGAASAGIPADQLKLEGRTFANLH